METRADRDDARNVPELPEVETVARLLRPKLVGRTITGGRVLWERTVGDSRAFLSGLRGATVREVGRRGKFVVARLDPEGWLVGHLRMTGRMHVERASWDPGSFAKVRLDLDDGSAFHFLDVRKFGRLWYVRELGALLGELGPEPLAPDFTVERFHAGLRARKRALKPLLLDQTFLAGLGNIYADESLFRARLHPLARSDRVTLEQAERLHREIRATLAEAIAREGSSFDAFYRTPEGNPGSYQDQFKVYGRTGEPCRVCGTEIRRLVVAQRGTHLCPRCQPAPRGARKSGASPRRRRQSIDQ
jgi:formamidopyrimidine-DNA glycosylase